MAASCTKGSDDQSPKKKWPTWIEFVCKLITVIVGLVVLSLGIWLVVDDLHGKPVAADFTRVGGLTQVETAVDASRFWLTEPRYVILVKSWAKPRLMVWAAHCAMLHNAPLLFTPPKGKKYRLVHATIDDWYTTKKIRSHRVVTIQSWGQCIPHKKRYPHPKGHKADIDGLSTLAAPGVSVKLPKAVPIRHTLAHDVIFAAAFAPRHIADVAIGLALGAHMATEHRPVSLVVVPRYLEADPGLEKKLEDQRQLVTGGVVLGQTITMPEDTRALLRQLLPTASQSGLLREIQAEFGNLGPFMGALLALLGFGAAASLAPKLVTQGGEIIVLSRESAGGRRAAKARVDWPGAVNDWLKAAKDAQEVTVWLRSGTRVTGKFLEWYPVDANQAKTGAKVPAGIALQLGGAELVRAGVSSQAESVLISLGEVELITRT